MTEHPWTRRSRATVLARGRYRVRRRLGRHRVRRRHDPDARAELRTAPAGARPAARRAGRLGIARGVPPTIGAMTTVAELESGARAARDGGHATSQITRFAARPRSEEICACSRRRYPARRPAGGADRSRRAGQDGWQSGERTEPIEDFVAAARGGCLLEVEFEEPSARAMRPRTGRTRTRTRFWPSWRRRRRAAGIRIGLSGARPQPDAARARWRTHWQTAPRPEDAPAEGARDADAHDERTRVGVVPRNGAPDSGSRALDDLGGGK